eukprot:3932346-Rhodomonas_salina.2
MAENDTFDPIDSEGEDDRDIQDCGAVYNEENYDDTISNLEEAIGAVHCLVQRTLAEVKIYKAKDLDLLEDVKHFEKIAYHVI